MVTDEEEMNARRKSLAQEIAEGMTARGCWVGNRDTDLINATGLAIDERDNEIKRLTDRLDLAESHLLCIGGGAYDDYIYGLKELQQ